jgi:hypothetical protein
MPPLSNAVSAQSPPEPSLSPGQWTHYRGDPANSGRSNLAAFGPVIGGIAWSAFPGTNEDQFIENYPLPVAGPLGQRVYIGSKLGVSAFEATSPTNAGVLIWQANNLAVGNDNVRGVVCDVRAALSGGQPGYNLVYAATRDGRFHCLKDTGSSFQNEWSTSGSPFFSRGALALSNTTVYGLVATEDPALDRNCDAGVVAFSRANGQFLFFLKTADLASGNPNDDFTGDYPPSVNNSTGRLYVQANASPAGIRCYDAAGQLQWTLPSVSAPYSHLAVDKANGRVITTDLAEIFSISDNGSSGSIAWHAPIATSNPELVLVSGKLFVGDVAQVQAFDALTGGAPFFGAQGTPLWTTTGSFINSSLLGNDSGDLWLVIFGQQTRFTVLDQANGTVLGTTLVNTQTSGNASLGPDGIYVMSGQGRFKLIKFD